MVCHPAERTVVVFYETPYTGRGFLGSLQFVLAIANGFLTVSTMKSLDLDGVRHVAMVVTEGFAPVIASFACLTVAWACVAIGVRKG